MVPVALGRAAVGGAAVADAVPPVDRGDVQPAHRRMALIAGADGLGRAARHRAGRRGRAGMAMKQLPGFLEHDADLMGSIGWNQMRPNSIRKFVRSYYATNFFNKSDALPSLPWRLPGV